VALRGIYSLRKQWKILGSLGERKKDVSDDALQKCSGQVHK
jgi:hypothetical protein